MLTELNQAQQSSDEKVWVTKLSFDIETRDSSSGESIHRTYTYTYSDEFDEWHLCRMVEKRCDESSLVGERDWTVERDVFWDSPEGIDIDVPSEVSDQLATVIQQDIELR